MNRVAAIVAAALVCVSMVMARVVWSSRTQLMHAHTFYRADAASAEQKIFYLGMAARLYLPLNPYSRAALHELVEQGTSDAPHALAANRAVRSAILATRSFYTREPQLLAQTNERIAAEMADLEVAADPHTDRVKSIAWHRERLDREDAPSVGWSLTAIFGFVLWVGAAFFFCRRAFGKRQDDNEDESLQLPYALASAGGVVVGMLLFWLGLHLA